MRSRGGTIRAEQVSLRRPEPRRGLVLVTVLLALVALMGIAALTIDLGRMTVAVQRTQAVADAAAMAAAHQLPDTDLANARLTDVVSANNEANPWPQVAINTAEDVTYYSAGDEVPDYGVLESNECAVTVQAHVDEEYSFAKVAGLEQMNVVRPATAKVTQSSGSLPCVFAHSTNPSVKGIWITGSNKQFHGAAHSNTKVKISGSSQHFYGSLTYRNDITIVGSNHQFDGGYSEGAILSYPVDYQWDDFLPWDYEVSSIQISGSSQSVDFGGVVHVLGDVKISGSNFTASNGLLLVEGDVKFSGSGHNLCNMTIVAKGEIDFTGSSQDIIPYTEDLVFMSLSSDTRAIDFAGSSRTSTGTLYAPNGGIEITGSGGRFHEGSLIAERIKITGSDHSVYGTPTGAGGGAKIVQLIQ